MCQEFAEEFGNTLINKDKIDLILDLRCSQCSIGQNITIKYKWYI